MTNTEMIALNVKRLRKTSGLSQVQLAKAAELSLAGYRNIETGKSIPRVDTLTALAAALQVPIQEMVTPVPHLKAVRFRSHKRLRSRSDVLATVSRWLSDFTDLEQLLNDRSDYSIGNKNSPTNRDPVSAAKRVREVFGLRDDESIHDICGLLESKGIKVLSYAVQSDAFFGLSVAPGDGGPAVIVNTWDRIPVERWIFTAAHELGHLSLHLQDYDVDQIEEPKSEEREANLFAAHFLMPAEAFQREWDDTRGMAFVERVMKVKRIFRVSYRTVLYRLSESMGAEVWKIFQLQYRQRSGRTLLRKDEPEALASDAFRASAPESSSADEPERLSKADFIEDRLSRLVRKAVETSVITLSRGAEILGLSKLEMRELSASWVG